MGVLGRKININNKKTKLDGEIMTNPIFLLLLFVFFFVLREKEKGHVLCSGLILDWKRYFSIMKKWKYF